MGSQHWFNILDPKVLKIGMEIQSCLDISEMNYEENDEGETDDEATWFDGKIVNINNAYNDVHYGRGTLVTLFRNDREDNWDILLNKETLQYCLLYIKEWDD